ncbi:MAG: CoA pyrophosphatase [Gemmatimonadetes bacterium]|nr:CoA pyrophosphatase [Gemmatimonadota bacterium]
MIDDVRLEALRQALVSREAANVARASPRGEAAVALIVRLAATPDILFIERSTRDGDPWSGQIALPGGRRAAADADLLATALREAEEETGIPLERSGTVLGRLDEMMPATRILPAIVIAPWVIAVPADTIASPDSHEVRSAGWIPIAALRDPESVSEVRLGRGDALARFPSIVWREYVIWGLTHRIVTQFLEIASGAGL